MRPILLRSIMSLLAVTAAGCQTLDLSALQRGDKPSDRVREIICLWEPAEGVGLDGLPTRGFAGQLLFFEPGGDQPVRVEGDVRIYVFDNQGTVEEQSKPLHQFDFPAAVWHTFARDTNLGPAYQVFVPYTRKGRHAADCAVRVRFTAESRLPIYSKLTSVALPGRRTTETPKPEAETPADTGTATVSQSQGHLPGAESFAVPAAHDTQLSRLRQVARSAVQTADFNAETATSDDDMVDETAASRRYRISGSVQQASGTAE